MTKRKREAKRTAALALPLGLPAGCGGKEDAASANGPANTYVPSVNEDQISCGVPGDEWAAHVTVKDTDTGEVLSEHDFPDRDA